MNEVNYTKLLTETPNGKEDIMSQIGTTVQLEYILLLLEAFSVNSTPKPSLQWIADSI